MTDARLYSRDTSTGFSRDVQPWDAFQNPTNGWRAEYDPERDDFWVTTPAGQGVYYRRIR